MAFKPLSDDEASFVGNDLQKQIGAKIGGVAGVASTSMSAMVNIEKTIFKPGETITVRIDIDNSNCKKDVKSFKTKLIRKI